MQKNMQKLIEKISKILVPNSKIIEFIRNRLLDDNYRGIVISQHNRWNIDLICEILIEMNKFEGKIEILAGDDKGGPYESCIDDYRSLVDNLRKKINHLTLNSLKKTSFQTLREWD
jgi:hypothetical protein